MPYFAVHYHYAPAQRTERDSNKSPHRAWPSEQVETGTVLTVGPFVDGFGALLLVCAADEEDAHRLVSTDAHCLRGLVDDITIREWTPVLGLLA